MQVDDEEIFEEYHSLRQTEHIPIHRFIEDHHLKISVKRFYNSYRRWLLENDLEYTYWNSREYLEWYCRYYEMDEKDKNRCFSVLKDVNRIKEEFNSLTIATSVFIISSGKPKYDIILLSGLTPTPIQKCMRWITDNGLISKETMKTEVVSHEQ